MYLPRRLPVSSILKRKSVLLLGPRRTGKSTFIKNEIKPDQFYNLLLADTFGQLSHRPSLIRESLRPNDQLIVIDEIQKLPLLMDEVHAMIEDHKIKFLLTGSSARKLKRTYTSLMAGRASSVRICPLVYPELQKMRWELNRILQFGTLPPVVLSDDPWDELRGYVGEYLQNEIQAEALSRNIGNFSRFLRTAAITHGELLNFEAIGSDAQVPARTVREYYSVLEDTLIGQTLLPLKKKNSRKAVSHSKFYFFDLGVLNSILGRRQIIEDSPEYGNLFETLVHQELRAYLEYSRRDESLVFWRTHEGDEVDFVIGEEVAIKAKATRLVTERHLKGLRTLTEQMELSKKWVVSRDARRRRLGDVEVIPIEEFLKELWAGGVV